MYSVLSGSDITIAMGADPGVGNSDNGGRLCDWVDPQAGGATLSMDAGTTSYASLCGISDPSVVKVAGVGDGACFLVAGTLGTSLAGGFAFELIAG